MIKTIRRWVKNMRWLLNSPPLDIKQGLELPCDYCGRQANWETPEMNICWACVKKALDKALKKGGE